MPTTLIDQYYHKIQEMKLLTSVANLLEWDQQNQMPPKATKARADKLALINKLHHERMIDKEFARILNNVYEQRDTLSDIDRRSVEFTKRQYDKKAKLPTAFVEKFSRATSHGHTSWVEAKEKEDFSLFQKDLQTILDLSKQYADYIDNSKPVYDVLTDDYEEGITSRDLDGIFNTLVKELPPLLKQMKKKQKKNALEGRRFDKIKTRAYIEKLVEQIGFDFTRGTMGDVPHPFETSITEHDIRINMKYPPDDIGYSIMSGIHELGHGLYEQNVHEDYHQTDLRNGVSQGIHESQSRLLENIIGRSEAFWTYALPLLQEHLPDEMGHVTVDDIVHDLNLVEPSFIRTEADEVTYNIHILLRYQLETDLLNNKLKVRDLPEAWNAKMKELLDIEPEKPSLGVLQDAHWSMGAVGYFPTYTLGNLNGAQLWKRFEKDHPKWEKKIAQGDFSEYFNWFKENIWQHGSFYQPQELMKRVTGEETNPDYFVAYVKEKYTNN
jgi:carboxypeptidase Taq